MKHIMSQAKEMANNIRVLLVTIYTGNLKIVPSRRRDLSGLDLGLPPNLEGIVIRQEEYTLYHLIHLRRQRQATKPHRDRRASCRIPSRRKFCHSENGWGKFVLLLTKAAHIYGFQIDRLKLSLPGHHHNVCMGVISKLYLRHVHTLNLDARNIYKRGQRECLTNIMLPTLEKSLPSLVYLTIQDRLPESDFGHIQRPCNIVALLQKHHWPSVRHMQIEEPCTSLATLQAFLLLYHGQSMSLHLRGECPVMTMSRDLGGAELETKHDDRDGTGFSNLGECGPLLKAWIKKVIAPKCFTTAPISDGVMEVHMPKEEERWGLTARIPDWYKNEPFDMSEDMDNSTPGEGDSNCW